MVTFSAWMVVFTSIVPSSLLKALLDTMSGELKALLDTMSGEVIVQ
jgi:hypothetical protein